MTVDLFIPCFVDQLYPETAFNMVKILEAQGCVVRYNKNQTCCGQPVYHAGYWDDARAVGQKFLKDFPDNDHYIVCLSGSCTGFVRNHYKRLFHFSSDYSKVKKIKKRLFEFSEFLTEILKVTDLGAVFQHTATYHDGCGSLISCGIKDAPRQLLRQVKGLELTEMKEAETCCGFGGTFSIKYEPVSTGMAHTKIKSALATGAEYMITSDLSCLIHLDAYIKAQGIQLKTIHLADVLAQKS